MDDDWMYAKSYTLTKRLDDDRKKGKFTDIIFVVGSDGNRCIFKAHKVILAAGNAEFENLFRGTKDSGLIKIPDVQPKGFENLIRYLYSATVQLEDLSSARETYHAAEKFKEDNLKLAVQMNLIKNIKCAPILAILQTAVELGMFRLKDKCLEIVSSEFEMVCASKEFILAPLGVIEAILSLCLDREWKFRAQALIALVKWMADRTLPDAIACHLYWLVLGEIPRKRICTNQSRASIESKIRALVVKFFSKYGVPSSKTESFSAVENNDVAVASPATVIAKEETSHAGEDESLHDAKVAVAQENSSKLTGENKVAIGRETSKKRNKKDENRIIEDKIFQHIKELADGVLKRHASLFSKDYTETFIDTAAKALQYSAMRLQNVIDDALYQNKQLPRRKIEDSSKKSEIDEEDSSTDS